MKSIRFGFFGPGQGLLWMLILGCISQPLARGQTNGVVTEDAIQLNFRGASLQTILDHFVSAAGFTVIMETEPKGTADIISERPVTRDQAFQLLNTVLMRNGLAAIRNGNLLTVVSREEAKTRDIPVKVGNQPDKIPSDDIMVTQVIPIQSTEATQLIKDLQPLVATATVMTANESANTIVVTDTQARIRRLVKIIDAIDSGSEELTAIKVFQLKNADPTELADVLTQLFPEQNNSNQQQGRQFGGPLGFGGPPGFGGPQATASSSGSQRLRKGMKVTAVADARTASLIVTAPKDLMPQIEGVVNRLDASDARKESIRVFKLQNANAEEVAQVLRETFERNQTSTRRNTSTQTDPLQNRLNQANSQNAIGGGFGAGGGGQGLGGGMGGGTFP